MKEIDEKTIEEMKGNIITEQIRELLADIWDLDLPEKRRKEYLSEVSAVIHVHYLTDNEGIKRNG